MPIRLWLCCSVGLRCSHVNVEHSSLINQWTLGGAHGRTLCSVIKAVAVTVGAARRFH